MENKETTKTSFLGGLFADPTMIMEMTKNPGKYAMNFYNSLTTRNKQYIVYGAGIALLIYGYTLKNKK